MEYLRKDLYFQLYALYFEIINQLIRGEICVANFIPSANGASQGNYFRAKFGGVCIFLSVKFDTSLLASLAGDKSKI